MTRTPQQVAALDQASAAAAEILRPVGGHVVNGADCVLHVSLTRTGTAHLTAPGMDMAQVARTLRTIADKAEQQGEP